MVPAHLLSSLGHGSLATPSTAGSRHCWAWRDHCGMANVKAVFGN